MGLRDRAIAILADVQARLSAPLDREFAVSEESLFRKYSLFPHSPDKLIKTKGFKIYSEMVKDDAIAQSLNALKLMRLASGWDIVAASDKPRDIEIRDFVLWNLKEFVEGSFQNDLWETLGALEIGFSISELVYTRVEGGKYSGKIAVKAIKSKNPVEFNIMVDDYDNILDDGVVRITQPQIGEKFPADKFIIYSWRKRYEGVFGTSMLRSLYTLWWLKRVLLRALGVYGEKFGVPVAVGKYPTTFKKADQDALFNVLRQLRIESAITIPKEVEVAFQEASGRGTGHKLFIEAIEHINEQITKTILGQTLTSGTQGVGSQALGRVHKDILTLYLEELGDDLATKAINPQIVKRLVDLNYANVDEYPKFEFEEVAPEDKTPLLDKYFMGVEKGVITPTKDDEVHVRELIAFPERNDDTEVQAPPPGDEPEAPEGDDDTPPEGDAPPPAPGAPDSDIDKKISQLALNGAQVTALLEVIEKFKSGALDRKQALALITSAFPIELETAISILGKEDPDAKKKALAPTMPPLQPQANDPAQRMPGNPATEAPAGKPDATLAELLAEPLFTGEPKRPLTLAESRADLTEIKRTIEDLGVDDITTVLTPIVNESIDKLLRDIKRKKIVEKKDVAAIRTLNVSGVGEMKRVITDGLERVGRRGLKSAKQELASARKQSKLAEPGDVSELTPKQLEKLLKESGFSMAGDIGDEISRVADDVLKKGIANGSTYREIADAIRSRLEPLLKRGQIDPSQASGASLERRVRNSVVSTFNTVRREQFRVEGDFVQFLQYSAILDDRVRPTHAKMSGKIYRNANPIWNKWTPSNGHNCRCLLLPLTLLDEGIEESAPTSLQPDKGFGASGE